MTQSFPAAESVRRIQDLRFAPFETVAHAHVSEEKNKRARRALYEQGISLYQQGQFTRALDQFRQLAIQDPEYPQLGHYLVQTEAAIEKERLARLGNAKQREIAEALRTGLAALEKQRFQEAQLSFERIVHLDPSHGEAHAYLDMVKVERKRQHDPHAAHRHYEAGLVAYASGKLDEARREWRIALRMNTQHEKARLALGKVEKELAFHVAQDKNDGPLP